MPVVASRVFDFLDKQEAGTVERHEIASAVFGILRRSLRQIVLKLRDADEEEALEISDRLRALLSEWLTVPVPFDNSMRDAVAVLLGEAEAVQARWGSDIRALYDTALRAAEGLPSIENPVRETLRAVICELRSQERTFKVYCHRRARLHFESLFVPHGDSPLSGVAFLHSVRDYRETEPFDALIKVGPLRTRGWGSAPDALLTAPRFGTLVQVVWSGCSDEPDFGYDPVSPPVDSSAADGTAPVAAASAGRGPMRWIVRVTRSGEDPGAFPGFAAEADELQVFREMNQPSERRPATLVQVDGEHGILYPPHSQVLSLDPDQAACDPIGRRIPGETLLESMYVIMPLVGDVDVGGVRAEHGHYSKIWKERLEKEWQDDAVGLIRRLHVARLNLVHLAAAVRHWCKPPSTVIHAPQQMKHFEILLRVLGVGSDGNNSPRPKWAPLWQLAWNEVRRSRGEAIQAGFHEQEVVEEQLLVILRRLVPEIREKALANAGFHQAIPASYDMKGDLLFFKVCDIEEGFSAPETELKVVRELNMIDQWRD